MTREEENHIARCEGQRARQDRARAGIPVPPGNGSYPVAPGICFHHGEYKVTCGGPVGTPRIKLGFFPTLEEAMAVRHEFKRARREKLREEREARKREASLRAGSQ